MKDPYMSFKKDKVGQNEDACQHLEDFMRHVALGLPKLKNTPSDASKLIKEGMDIKNNYKKIISESTLSAVDKAKAIGIIGLNVLQMTKIGPLVKKNCEKVKMYGEDIKESSGKLVSDKKKIESIG